MDYITLIFISRIIILKGFAPPVGMISYIQNIIQNEITSSIRVRSPLLSKSRLFYIPELLRWFNLFCFSHHTLNRAIIL